LDYKVKMNIKVENLHNQKSPENWEKVSFLKKFVAFFEANPWLGNSKKLEKLGENFINIYKY